MLENFLYDVSFSMALMTFSVLNILDISVDRPAQKTAGKLYKFFGYGEPRFKDITFIKTFEKA